MPFRLKTFHELEKGYDNHLNLINVSRRIATASKQFGFPINEKSKSPFDFISELKPSSYENSYYRDDHNYTAKNRPSFDQPKPQSAFSSITSALGFKHHQGTDREKELGVLKIIILRESTILKIKSLCYKISQCDILVRSSTKLESELLDVLALMRTITTNYIEHLLTWRKSIIEYEPHNPKAFKWEGQNYTLKLIHDLDFLADQPMLVASLRFSEEKMIGNPLMLPNNLEEAAQLIIDPLELAVYDSEGQSTGTFFEERLRIRKAEKILLQELECYFFQDSKSIDGEMGLFENSNISMLPNNLVEVNKQGQSETAILAWKINAQMQLKNIVNLQGEKLRSSSTGRLSDPKTVSVPNSPKVAHPNAWLAEPTRLNILFEPSNSGRQSRPETASTISARQTIQNRQSSFNDPPFVDRTVDEVFSFDEMIDCSKRSSQEHEIGDVREENFKASYTGSIFGSLEEKSIISDNILSTSIYSAYSTQGIENIVCTITAYELQRIETLDFFPPRLVLATAAIVILMSSIKKGEDIPQDVSLAAFKTLAKSPEFLSTTMNNIDILAIDKIKIKALTPYIPVLNRHDDFPSSNLSTNEIKIANKLCKWVVQVVTFAVSSEVNPYKINKNRIAKMLPNKTAMCAGDIAALPTFSKRIQNFKKDVKNISSKQKGDLIKNKDTDQLNQNVALKIKKKRKVKDSETLHHHLSTYPGRETSKIPLENHHPDSVTPFFDSSLVHETSLIDGNSPTNSSNINSHLLRYEENIICKPEIPQAPNSNRSVKSARLHEKTHQPPPPTMKIKSEYTSTRLKGGAASSLTPPLTSNRQVSSLLAKQPKQKNVVFEISDNEKQMKEPVDTKILIRPASDIGIKNNLSKNINEYTEESVSKPLATIAAVPFDIVLSSSSLLSEKNEGCHLEDTSSHDELTNDRSPSHEDCESKGQEVELPEMNDKSESYHRNELEINRDGDQNDDFKVNVQQKRISIEDEKKANLEEVGDKEVHAEGEDYEEAVLEKIKDGSMREGSRSSFYEESVSMPPATIAVVPFDIVLDSGSLLSEKNEGCHLEDTSSHDERTNDRSPSHEDCESKDREEELPEMNDKSESYHRNELEINRDGDQNDDFKVNVQMGKLTSEVEKIEKVTGEVRDEGEYTDDEDYEEEPEADLEKTEDSSSLEDKYDEVDFES